jgi:DNA-binding CsgD family transcriptional regulator
MKYSLGFSFATLIRPRKVQSVASIRDSDRRRHVVVGDHMSIGRGSDNDLVLSNDPKVSRSHAVIFLQNGQWILEDLASSNGTWVNRFRITVHPLDDGESIRIGDSIFVYVADADDHATEIEPVRNDVSIGLTKREREILDCVANGLTDNEISEQLFIGKSTVRSHLDRIRAKTGLRRRIELARLALELDS